MQGIGNIDFATTPAYLL